MSRIVIADDISGRRYIDRGMGIKRRTTGRVIATAPAYVCTSLGIISAVCPAGVHKSTGTGGTWSGMAKRDVGWDSVQSGAFPKFDFELSYIARRINLGFRLPATPKSVRTRDIAHDSLNRGRHGHSIALHQRTPSGIQIFWVSALTLCFALCVLLQAIF